MHLCANILENVPPLGDSRPIVLAGWQQIQTWIKEQMQVDVALVVSRSHQFQWMWTNLAPPEVFQSTYRFILRSPMCLVDDILDLG
jgi:hypothetical protein